MLSSPRVKWLTQAVSDLLEMGNPAEAEALLRDPDALAVVTHFFRGNVDAIVFFFQPKEVGDRGGPRARFESCRGDAVCAARSRPAALCTRAPSL